jgi:hypothetical protein
VCLSLGSGGFGGRTGARPAVRTRRSSRADESGGLRTRQ